MEPALHSGQYVLIRKTNQNIGKGDIVIIQIGRKQIVKRVIALPEERVSSDEKQRVLNQDEYYVLGDNKEHSMDSRTLGPIKREQILGIVIQKE